MITIRPTLPSDIDSVLAIFDEARAFQRASGFVQWIDGYPSREVVEADMAAASSYSVEIDGIIAGYFFIAYDDAGYREVEESWEYHGHFAVVHRLAFSPQFRGCGFAPQVIRLAEKIAESHGARSMRIDTGSANARMQHIMDKLGYEPRGLLSFPWGPRLGYELCFKNQDRNQK